MSRPPTSQLNYAIDVLFDLVVFLVAGRLIVEVLPEPMLEHSMLEVDRLQVAQLVEGKVVLQQLPSVVDEAAPVLFETWFGREVLVGRKVGWK